MQRRYGIRVTCPREPSTKTLEDNLKNLMLKIDLKVLYQIHISNDVACPSSSLCHIILMTWIFCYVMICIFLYLIISNLTNLFFISSKTLWCHVPSHFFQTHPNSKSFMTYHYDWIKHSSKRKNMMTLDYMIKLQYSL